MHAMARRSSPPPLSTPYLALGSLFQFLLLPARGHVAHTTNALLVFPYSHSASMSQPEKGLPPVRSSSAAGDTLLSILRSEVEEYVGGYNDYRRLNTINRVFLEPVFEV